MIKINLITIIYCNLSVLPKIHPPWDFNKRKGDGSSFNKDFETHNWPRYNCTNMLRSSMTNYMFQNGFIIHTSVLRILSGIYIYIYVKSVLDHFARSLAENLIFGQETTTVRPSIHYSRIKWPWAWCFVFNQSDSNYAWLRCPIRYQICISINNTLRPVFV